MLRVTPDPEIRDLEIPTHILNEIKGLFQQCFVGTTIGGTGFGHTDNKEVAERLAQGWVVGDYTNGAGQTTPVTVSCPGSLVGIFKMERNAEKTYYDFTIPPALVALVREMNDAA